MSWLPGTRSCGVGRRFMYAAARAYWPSRARCVKSPLQTSRVGGSRAARSRTSPSTTGGSRWSKCRSETCAMVRITARPAMRGAGGYPARGHVTSPVRRASEPADKRGMHSPDDPTEAPALLALTPRSAARVLLLVMGALALAALVAGVLRFRFGVEHGPLNVIPLFDLDEERSIPTYFSAALLALSAALLAVIGRLARARRAPYAWHWLG